MNTPLMNLINVCKINKRTNLGPLGPVSTSRRGHHKTQYQYGTSTTNKTLINMLTDVLT